MDLNEVRAGDKVYSCLKGWGKVVDESNGHHFNVKFHRVVLGFYLDGKASSSDIHPEITDWKSKRWEPSATNNLPVLIEPTGAIKAFSLSYIKEELKEGRTYNTKNQAKYAYKSIRACQIFNAYVAEFAPDWRPDWDNIDTKKWFVVFDQIEWYIDCIYTHQSFGTVYMPKEIAEKLCEDLNRGVVQL